MLAYVGLMLTHVEPKDPKNGNSKTTLVKRKMFWWSVAYLGAMLAHLGAMLAYLEGNVGPSWGYVGPSWGYVGRSWGYVGPSWGLCWPMLGLCWPILRPMLAHVDPSWATSSEKWEKWEEHKTQNTVKRGRCQDDMPAPSTCAGSQNIAFVPQDWRGEIIAQEHSGPFRESHHCCLLACRRRNACNCCWASSCTDSSTDSSLASTSRTTPLGPGSLTTWGHFHCHK